MATGSFMDFPLIGLTETNLSPETAHELEITGGAFYKSHNKN